MINDALPNARAILTEELKLAHFHSLTEPDQIFQTLDGCLDRTYKQIRSACWGNKVRTIACDVLFKEAISSVTLARSSMEALTVSSVSAGQDEEKETSADWLQPFLLLLSAGLALVTAISIHGLNILPLILGVLATLCILIALIRECQRLLRSGVATKILFLASKVFKKAKWLKPRPTASAAKKGSAKTLALALNAEALEAACLHQMDVIDSNLALFHDPVQSADSTGTLLPLARTLLQEKYACSDSLNEAVEAELSQYLRANGLRAVDYDDQHASLFQTQPMDETFTIFPAIVDEKGCVVEQGIAGVRED